MVIDTRINGKIVRVKLHDRARVLPKYFEQRYREAHYGTRP